MSINRKRFSARLTVFALILSAACLCAAQDVETKIVVSNDSIVTIEGAIKNENAIQPNANWSFTNQVAGAENLGTRVSDFTLTDASGRAVGVRKLTDGEYLANNRAAAFRYRIDLKPFADAATAAHVSHLAGNRGVLMLDDLLPRFSENSFALRWHVEFDLPSGWKIISSEKRSDENVFDVKNIERAIFAVGTDWRVSEQENLSVAISGEWKFADAEAAQMAGDIYKTYENLLGEAANERTQIILAHLPADAKFGRWHAETRGSTLTIFSADMPFKAVSLQLLHEQLRHEIFHLWIPNRLALSGNYDWFYEGFAVYQALRTGVAKNQIRFEDFLDTLARAYDLDRMQTAKTSLVAASKNRWNGATSQIYARGMLVAFLCDAAILRRSKGKRSIENILREAFQKHRAPQALTFDGNAAILEILKARAELKFIVADYIEGAQPINWTADLAALGIEAADENSFVKLNVKAKLGGAQKDLLNELGYNNWRKISRKSK